MIEKRTVEIMLEDPELARLAANPSGAFTQREIAALGDGRARAQRIAARMAAKRAFIGLFPGTGFLGLEILAGPGGKPCIIVAPPGPAGLVSARVSLTHTKARAAAMVVVERNETGRMVD